MKKIFLIAFCLTAFAGFVHPQTKTNLEIVYSLLDQSADKIDSVLKGENNSFSFKFNSPPDYQFLRAKILDSFIKRSYNIKQENGSANLEYNITNISTSYGESFKDGFFGDYYVERSVVVQGSAIISNSGKNFSSIDFNETYRDSVRIEEITALENESLPFTKSQIPPPPVFSNLLEPIIVVGTLIVTVILLFTIRSK